MNKIEQAEKEIREIIKKYNLEMNYRFEFPIYRILPDEVKLALNIIGKHGMKILMILKERK